MGPKRAARQPEQKSNPAADVKAVGAPCFPDLVSIPGTVDGVVIATHPKVSVELVRRCLERGIRRVRFHRSFGQGGVSEEAVRECQAHRLSCIVGGCPLMYLEPVDRGHRCFR